MARKDTEKKKEKEQTPPSPAQQPPTRSELTHKKYDDERKARAADLKKEQAARKEEKPKWPSQRSAQEAKEALGRFVEDNEARKQQGESKTSDKEAPKHERSSTTLQSPNNLSRSFATPSKGRGLPIEFYCWKEGKLSTIFIMALSQPNPL